MAVGSNSLGLLFKVGVDAGDAQKAFQQLMATNKEFAKGVEEGMKAEAQAFAGANTSLKATTDSAKQLGITFNQVRVAIGQLIGGLTLVRAFHEIAQAVGEIGTRSKESFDELQKQVESAGGHITELQRNIAQELVGAFDRLKGASAGFMAEVIEKAGPALINLLKDIADWLGRLRPLAAAVGDDIADTFNRLNAIGRTIEGLKQRQQPGVGQGILEALFPPLAAKRALDQMGEFDADYAKHLKNIQEENKKFIAAPAAFDAGGAGKIRAVKKEVDELAKAIRDAQKELDKLREKTGDIIIQNMEDQLKDLNKTLLEVTDPKWVNRFVESKFAIFDFAQVIHDQMDLIVQDIAKATQPIPGGGAGVPGLPDDATIQKGLDDAFKHYEGFFERLKEGIAGVAQDWRDKLNRAIEELPTHIVEAFTNSFETLLDTFIKTGHTGPAVMKQFVSQVLQSIALLAAQLAALAFGYALLMLAFQNYHDAALAAAAGIALTALAIGLGYASRAVAPSSASSSAGAGTGFGGAASEAPGTVTVNQGAGSGLGIQLQQLNALNNISNKLDTASPGDIVTRGAEQNPVAIGQANNEASRRDGSISREFLQISGLRTA